MPLNLQTSLSSKLTAGLLLCLKLKKGAHVMIATNIELNDRLTVILEQSMTLVLLTPQ